MVMVITLLKFILMHIFELTGKVLGHKRYWSSDRDQTKLVGSEFLARFAFNSVLCSSM